MSIVEDMIESESYETDEDGNVTCTIVTTQGEFTGRSSNEHRARNRAINALVAKLDGACDCGEGCQ